MFPWQEKPQNVSVLDGEPLEDNSGVHHIALKSIAHSMIQAFKSGDADSLAESLDLLCELCVEEYDKD